MARLDGAGTPERKRHPVRGGADLLGGDQVPHYRNTLVRASRPILTARRPGIEKLLDQVCPEATAREGVRAFTLWLTGQASRWQLGRCKSGMFGSIPLTIRKRNGRPKIVPPADVVPDTGGVDPHVLKAIAKAWSWRRKLESGAAATLADIAMAENVTSAYAGRMLKLAYLAPAVLEKLLLERMAPAASIKEMAAAAELPWHRQITAIFNSEAATTLQPPSLSHSEPAG